MTQSSNIDSSAVGTHDLSLEQKLSSLPSKPGVYQFKSADGKVVYVGKAQNLRSRVRQYFQRSRSSDTRIDAMVSKIVDVELTVTDSEVEALILEANLIKRLKPRYNVVLKDDKSYPYIVITDEPFPRVFVTRKKVGGRARYFGPYTDVKTMRFALKTIKDIFMIRSCNYDLSEESIVRGKYKVCLDYHIKKCEGPCEGLVSAARYNTMINQVAQVLRGKSRAAAEALRLEMEGLSAQMRYEEAALVRDRLRALEVYAEKQKVVEAKEVDRDVFGFAVEEDDACGVVFKVREGKVVGSQHFYLSNVMGRSEGELLEQLIERVYLEEEDIPGELWLSAEVNSASLLVSWLEQRRKGSVVIGVPKPGAAATLISLARNNARFWLDEFKIQKMKSGDFVPQSIKALQKDLRLPGLPRRIECFDISNIQGSDTVASMVVFADAKPRKSEYRKFSIRSVAGPNDFASMTEVVERRYSRLLREQGALPDLVMVDGGKGQLSSAVAVLRHLGLDSLPTIGLAKRLEEIFVPGSEEAVLLPRTSPALRLLQQIRDEAHRFAVSYHRSVRSKRILQTELDLIEGVGKKRTKELLEAFGSVQGVKFATAEQLEEIVGEKVAQRVKEYFEEEEAEGAGKQEAGTPN